VTETSAIPLSNTRWRDRLNKLLFEQVSIAPLIVFRILFGLMMCAGTLRFALNGWIEDLYIKPKFHFTYYGFEWVKPLGEKGMYICFFIMGLSALAMAFGFLYRWSATLFFITFTYVELIDKSTYLNHYYFVSIISALLIFLPAGRNYSIDILIWPKYKTTHIPRYFLGIIKLQLGMVYFFAGVAKLNYDWLFEAMPLRIWLQPHTEMPVLGYFMDKTWVAYFFSWFGAIYDLSIPFLLLFSRSRTWAYLFVIAFHVLTYMLFQIGLFPFIMILCTLIFFSEKFHQSLLDSLSSFVKKAPSNQAYPWKSKPVTTRIFLAILLLHFGIQLMMPFRYLLYPGNLFWTEQGFRFSWRVMLMEKAGKCFFYVTDVQTGKKSEIIPADYLTRNQEKMMATQADMILEFAHFIKEDYNKNGYPNVKVTVDSYVSLNGTGSRRYIDSCVDLGSIKESLQHKSWILPYTASQTRP
jgi:Vitamin K-dependent gamma-carboxylase